MPKPALNQVLLTRQELAHLIGSAPGATEAVIRGIFATLNYARCGAPAGVIRRSPAGTVVLRTQSTATNSEGRLLWEVLSLGDGDDASPAAEDIVSWREIHSERWEHRLTVQDYEALEDTK